MEVLTQGTASSFLLVWILTLNALYSLVFHYASDIGKLSPSLTSKLHISLAEEILNKKSGWAALTGTTDFGAIAASSESSHQLAFDIFVDRIAGFLGSYYVSLQGQVDALVFAGGIGEKSSKLRAAVVQKVKCLGFAVRNVEDVGEDVVRDISEPGCRHKVLVCQTDEQFEMARLCAAKDELWS